MSHPAEVAFDAGLRRIWPGGVPTRIGLAVSGGSDSVAMMHLAAARLSRELHVATVDHGLRPESTTEAAWVAEEAAGIGLSCEALRWEAAPHAATQAAARDARIGLLTDWAARLDLAAVLTAHTMDDQAETVLMRLARGGGPRALAGIPKRRGLFARPLLGARRADLRDWLRARGGVWIEDPSNEDDRFERVRWRRALPQLDVLGLSVPALARTAARMARVGQPEAAVELALDGTVRLDLAPAPEALAAAIRLVGTSLPRLSEVERAAEASAPRVTLGGCIVARRRGETVVSAEPERIADLRSPLDGRGRAEWRGFRIEASALARRGDADGAHVAMLGRAGARAVPRRIDLSHMAYLALPAIWRDGALLAFDPNLHLPGGAAGLARIGPPYALSLRPVGQPDAAT